MVLDALSSIWNVLMSQLVAFWNVMTSNGLLTVVVAVVIVGLVVRLFLVLQNRDE